MRHVMMLCVLLAGPGCSAFNETMERGLALEKEGKVFERSEQFEQGLVAYGEAEVELGKALEMAKERRQGVLTSFMNHKLSLVTSGQARCSRPNVNPAGTWEGASELFGRAGTYAMRSSFFKLKTLSLCDQADCQRPDKNPAGSWETAAELYGKASALSKTHEDDQGRAMALRLQAICLMEGKAQGPFPKTIRRMLEKARKLGDEDAADMLVSESEGGGEHYCVACGGDLADNGAKFCASCGHEQSEPVGTPRKKEEPRGPMQLNGPGKPATPAGMPRSNN